MLPHNTLVKIRNTTSPLLDGKYAHVKGIATHHPEGTHYIIEMYEPLETGYTNLVLTEHCLETV